MSLNLPIDPDANQLLSTDPLAVLTGLPSAYSRMASIPSSRASSTVAPSRRRAVGGHGRVGSEDRPASTFGHDLGPRGCDGDEEESQPLPIEQGRRLRIPPDRRDAPALGRVPVEPSGGSGLAYNFRSEPPTSRYPFCLVLAATYAASATCL